MSNQAYPLSWPKGWPRTDQFKREAHPRFQQTLASALKKLRGQIELLHGKALVLSSNVTLGHENPQDPGVVAYFQLDTHPMAIPCDRWKHVEDNVYAIALTVEAMRGMERWGAKHMIAAMFSGFKALPDKAGIDYRAVLGIDPSAKLSEELVTFSYRQRSKTEHPDQGGTPERFAAIREAHDMLMKNVRSQTA